MTIASRASKESWRTCLEVTLTAAGCLLSAWSMYMAFKQSDPYHRKRASSRDARLQEQLKLKSVRLDEYEELLLDRVVRPGSIEVELEDVFGLDELITTLEDEVLAPLDPQLRSLTCSSPLWSLVKGVLLYGPPGTGKTMLAKALAKRAGCNLINIAPSAINSKYFGDANRLVKATFTLARKLQPCIIFVDEVDALLSRRGSLSEHEGSLQIKNEFLALWDGLDSDANTGVLVLGTTNRIDRMDEAALRRFSLRREVPLPREAQRRAILAGYLRKHAAAAPAERRVAAELLREVELVVTAECRQLQEEDGEEDGEEDVEAVVVEEQGQQQDGCDAKCESDCSEATDELLLRTAGRSGSSTPSTATNADSSGSGSGGVESRADPTSCGGSSNAGTGGCEDVAGGGHGPAGLGEEWLVAAAAARSRRATSGARAQGPRTARGGRAAEATTADAGVAIVATPVLDDLAARTEGFSSYDLFKLCSRAAQSTLLNRRIRARQRHQATLRRRTGDRAASVSEDGSGAESSPRDVAALLQPLTAADLRRVLDSMRHHNQMQAAAAPPVGSI